MSVKGEAINNKIILTGHALKAVCINTLSRVTEKGKKNKTHTVKNTGSSAPTSALWVNFKALMRLLLIPAFPAFFPRSSSPSQRRRRAGRGGRGAHTQAKGPLWL